MKTEHRLADQPLSSVIGLTRLSDVELELIAGGGIRDRLRKAWNWIKKHVTVKVDPIKKQIVIEGK